MKRELLQNIKVQPYHSEDVIERTGFLSGIIGAAIGTDGDLTLTIVHSDDGITFDTVSDKNLFPEKQTKDCIFTIKSLVTGNIVNIDVDFAGLKNFVKIVVSGTAATNTTLAVALGDTSVQPV